VRHHESGRDGQEARRGQRRDLVAEIQAGLPDARIEASPGRLLVDTAEDASSVLAEVHGVLSFSPCRRCGIDDLAPAVVALAVEVIPPGTTFAIRVKRSGSLPEPSMSMAGRLGSEVLARLPDRRVDLAHPAVTLAIEIRDGHAYLFHTVTAGIDHRSSPPMTTGALRFIADQMLGRLAAWLRLLGHDTLHPWDHPDSWLLRTTRRDGRIILTRDGPLACARSVRVHWVGAADVIVQLADVIAAFDLDPDPARLFTRCPRCNDLVEAVARDAVLDRLPPAVAANHDTFRRCTRCDRVYWRGDHCERILARLATACAACRR